METVSTIFHEYEDEKIVSPSSLKPACVTEIPKILCKEFQGKLNDVGATLTLYDNPNNHISLSARFTASKARPDIIIIAEKECVVADIALDSLVDAQIELAKEIFARTKTLAHNARFSFYLREKNGSLKNCNRMHGIH